MPTIECELKTKRGFFKAAVPSGTSTGKYEAVALEAAKAKGNIEQLIAPALLDKEITQQKELDNILLALDKTNNKSKLGANAILGVSMAGCRALAGEAGVALYKEISRYRDIEISKFPLPCFNILEGGRHVYPVGDLFSCGAKNNLAIQEFMVAPQADSFQENMLLGQKVYEALKEILLARFGQEGIMLGMEGGFAPALEKTEQALGFLQQALQDSGCCGRVMIGLDAAGSELEQDGVYEIDGRSLKSKELLAFYQDLIKQYPIAFIEDPFSQDDIIAWKAINRQSPIANRQVFVVGDDLTTTNSERIKMAQEQGLCNGIIIKPNQIGTVSETIEAVRLAQSFGWKVVVSHRSGETIDSFIADLAVGLGADYIKSGATSMPERLAKYDRLMEIEKEIGNE